MTAAKKKRKKRPAKGRFRKSLRQSTHPIPGEKVEESEKKYDRGKTKKESQKDIDAELDKEE
ncbi:MAG: hypothetical protein QF613_01890 [Candidatus Marinimicrobia bacterium]|jgi:hypothetical protein|nr:hypothetical protein [Candidatus Neomarinimicrobiota bacterium]MDP6455881.1 hypothetical protein [Candidatus Neomarinimicrobiota bacterium]MDP6592945.1 hypothetical protein [Candidatus Neomarinimicrobiota bacterium]MDP6835969.1 hypothetical protein [Candidatus Neomarinimicrobiota bacterium]MDP6966013.1 hypothetical protein [Candidatus Neomarinimicrobiota bacterium]|tara:strand:+ start:184 stop:369 length:186 start_codon:yes stop_codon:yes gene_type:complete